MVFSSSLTDEMATQLIRVPVLRPENFLFFIIENVLYSDDVIVAKYRLFKSNLIINGRTSEEHL